MQTDLTAIERVIVAGDLSKLTPDERWNYYKGVCQSVGLNPFTQPFLYITLSGKLVLYATKGAADQLRDNHHISISQPKVDLSDGLCIVTVTATDRTGRTDSDLGIVPCENLRGDAKANAILKAVTKAKRRVTLSMCGLGMLDETEVETIPNARPMPVDVAHGAPTITSSDPAPTPINAAATDEERAKFDAVWKKGMAAAAACGVGIPDKPAADATNAQLTRAARDLSEQVANRRKLNAEMVEKIAQVREASGDPNVVADVDPTTVTTQEAFEMIETLNDMLSAAGADDSDAPF